MSEYDALLREADELDKAATPGPWAEYDDPYNDQRLIYAGGERGTFERCVIRMDDPEYGQERDVRDEDVALIARSRTLVPELAAALRASEARAEAAEKRELAYRDALLASNGVWRVLSFCIEVGCNNPATTTKVWNLSKVPVCPEHAPEAGA